MAKGKRSSMIQNSYRDGFSKGESRVYLDRSTKPGEFKRQKKLVHKSERSQAKQEINKQLEDIEKDEEILFQIMNWEDTCTYCSLVDKTHCCQFQRHDSFI